MRQLTYSETELQELYELLKKQIAANPGEDSVKITLPTANKRVVLNFTGLAWLKMRQLVGSCNIEIAWHGIVTVNEDHSVFTVHDILVYPQKIAAATVEIDEPEYNIWHQALDNDTYNTLHLQGHSHVNFGATPSGRDSSTYAELMQYVKPDGFYVFLINNKANALWCKIVDRGGNAVYYTKDIDVLIEGVDLKQWYKDIEKTQLHMVQTVTPTYHYVPQSSLFDQQHPRVPAIPIGFNDTPPDPTDPEDPMYDPFYVADSEQDYKQDKAQRHTNKNKTKKEKKGK